MNELHHELKGLKLFEVGSTNLDGYINHKVYKLRKLNDNPSDPDNNHIIKFEDSYVQRKSYWDRGLQDFVFTEEPLEYIIKQVQKIYDGSLAYRIYFENDTFGYPVKPEKLLFI